MIVNTVPRRPPGLDLPPAGPSARSCAAGSAAASDPPASDAGSFQDALSAAVDDGSRSAADAADTDTSTPDKTPAASAKPASIPSLQRAPSEEMADEARAQAGDSRASQASGDDQSDA